MTRRLLSLIFPALLAAVSGLAAARPITGLWDAVITVNDIEIPFRFEISSAGAAKASGAFFNGDERVLSTGGRFDGRALSLEFAHYAAKLEVKLANGELNGTYTRGTHAPYPVHARRFVPVDSAAAAGSVPSIDGLWEIETKSSKGEQAWKLMVRQSGAEASAVILRVDGDTGTLSGNYRDGKFVLSHFSGARPSLLEISLRPDGTLGVLQNKKSEYTAFRSAEARAKGLPEPADPSRWTSVKDPTEPLHFSAHDLNGKLVTDADPRFRGKVVLVNITGSWCPNCHDEAPFLEELYRKYRKQGLEIVALSFEEAEQLKDLTRLKAFIRNYGIDYTVLVGGETTDLPKVLPQAVNLNTWPASFFLGRDGLVRGAHAGFAGKATGEAHEHLKAEITATVERLLAENVQTSLR
jgi:thiol-disulfide isomerase/thioredoxin